MLESRQRMDSSLQFGSPSIDTSFDNDKRQFEFNDTSPVPFMSNIIAISNLFGYGYSASSHELFTIWYRAGIVTLTFGRNAFSKR